MTFTQIILACVSLILTTFISWLCERLVVKINTSIKNEKVRNLVLDALSIVERSVKLTYQVYVEHLKDKNLFDTNAQKEALEHCKNIIKNDLSNEFKEYLLKNSIPIDEWVVPQIESTIYDLKK